MRPTGDALRVSRPGSVVDVEDIATGRHLSYRLADAHDAAPGDGLLSVDSPVGLVLTGRCPGQIVTASTPRGHRRFRILAVT